MYSTIVESFWFECLLRSFFLRNPDFVREQSFLLEIHFRTSKNFIKQVHLVNFNRMQLLKGVNLKKFERRNKKKKELI